jgi:murein L,D-transpeptidase YcbB/YkuD
MSDLVVLQHRLHDRTEFLHRCQAQHAVLTPHDPHNDAQAVALLTELFASWGQRVEHGVFDDNLREAIAQFQYDHGVHPDNGVVYETTWAALAAALWAEVGDLQHQVSVANGHGTSTPMPPPAQVAHDIQVCEWLLSEIIGTQLHPPLSAHAHNDGARLSVVIWCFRIFDEASTLNHASPPAPWGSANLPEHEYGVGLQDAVRRFQQMHSLPDTGEVDPNTWGALGREVEFTKADLHRHLPTP